LGLIDRENETKIIPIKTEEYPTAAKRPINSILSKEKVKRTFDFDIRSWIGALKDYLHELSLQRK
jgi:dTDP-4-dehydrorhamnose reductase